MSRVGGTSSSKCVPTKSKCDVIKSECVPISVTQTSQTGSAQNATSVCGVFLWVGWWGGGGGGKGLKFQVCPYNIKYFLTKSECGPTN
jgi:hypothetical protein